MRYDVFHDDNKVKGPLGDVSGAYYFRHGTANLCVIASDGGGWDHVSVSLKTRCPTWDEMCFIREKFFADHEWSMQLHPPKTENVNYHKFCLHLWRPQTSSEIEAIKSRWEADGEAWPYDIHSPGEIPLPPSIFVGPPAISSTAERPDTREGRD